VLLSSFGVQFRSRTVAGTGDEKTQTTNKHFKHEGSNYTNKTSFNKMIPTNTSTSLQNIPHDPSLSHGPVTQGHLLCQSSTGYIPIISLPSLTHNCRFSLKKLSLNFITNFKTRKTSLLQSGKRLRESQVSIESIKCEIIYKSHDNNHSSGKNCRDGVVTATGFGSTTKGYPRFTSDLPCLRLPSTNNFVWRKVAWQPHGRVNSV